MSYKKFFFLLPALSLVGVSAKKARHFYTKNISMVKDSDGKKFYYEKTYEQKKKDIRLSFKSSSFHSGRTKRKISLKLKDGQITPSQQEKLAHFFSKTFFHKNHVDKKDYFKKNFIEKFSSFFATKNAEDKIKQQNFSQNLLSDSEKHHHALPALLPFPFNIFFTLPEVNDAVKKIEDFVEEAARNFFDENKQENTPKTKKCSKKSKRKSSCIQEINEDGEDGQADKKILFFPKCTAMKLPCYLGSFALPQSDEVTVKYIKEINNIAEEKLCPEGYFINYWNIPRILKKDGLVPFVSSVYDLHDEEHKDLKTLLRSLIEVDKTKEAKDQDLRLAVLEHLGSSGMSFRELILKK